MELTTAQLDRACGVLLAAAAGDALGAGYEWTDNTSLALVIAETASAGSDLRTVPAQDAILAGWAERAKKGPAGHTAESSALARTAPVALAFLNDPDGLTQAAAAISALTHDDLEVGEACALWCHAIRHAVLTGELDARCGLERLPEPSRTRWAKRLREAEQARDITLNGQVVQALQAAWRAIAETEIPQDAPAAGRFRADHLRLALETVVRGGQDDHTIAAIAGSLLGAAYGASAVPAGWRLKLHGPLGLNSRDIVALAIATATGTPYKHPVYGGGYRPAVNQPHPDDRGLVLADIAALRNLPAEVTAVVSLCSVGKEHEQAILAHTPHWLQVRLEDTDDPAENQNLDFVLHDTVTAIEELRASGHVVLVHCVAAYSRTPTIGALYAMRRTGVSPDEAISAMDHALPEADPTDAFRDALNRLRRR